MIPSRRTGRTVALLIACTLLLGGAAGGTVAWLIGQSAPVQNTFTTSGISVTVAETDTGDGDDNPHTNTYTMLPGATITKDPVVTVEAGSEAAWLFVQLDKSSNFDSFMSFTVDSGWATLSGVENVYWREVGKSDAAQAFGVIAGNAVTVKPEVTAAMLNALTDATRPTLTVTAYAVQQQSIGTALEAWALVQDQSANS